jgi:hypothetical protein
VFGRRKDEDEDPFAALKQGGTYQSAPSTPTLPGIPGSTDQPEPVRPRTTVRAASSTARAASSTARAAPKAGAGKRRRGGGPRYGRHVFLLRFLAPVVAVGAAIAFSSIHNAGHSPSITSINNAPGLSPGGGVSITHAPPRPTSYLTTANLTAGLARVQRMAPGSRVLNLRIDSTSLDAEVAVHGGNAKEISLSPSGDYDISLTNLNLPSFPFSDIRPSVIPRLLAELQRRFHVHLAQFDYAVADAFAGSAPTWGLFLKNDKGYLASISGAHLQPVP